MEPKETSAQQFQISVELKQVAITKGVLRICGSYLINPSEYNKYELLNCIERWLMSVANIDQDYAPYTIYKQLSIKSELYKKLEEEFFEKRLFKQEKNWQIVSHIHMYINDCLKSPIKIFNFIPKYDPNTGILSYGNIFEINIKGLRNIQFLLEKQESSIYDVLLIVLRYCTILTGGQHWAIPTQHYDYLRRRLGVRNEGFASALNTKAIYYQIKGDESKFCSLFPDIEKKFGSIGSFFKMRFADHAGMWSINPPFLESIISEMSRKILNRMRKAKSDDIEFIVFTILPNWIDMIDIKKLVNSEFTVGVLFLNSGDMFFEQLDGSPYQIRTKHIYIALYSLMRNKGVEFAQKNKQILSALHNIKKVKPLPYNPPPIKYSHLFLGAKISNIF